MQPHFFFTDLDTNISDLSDIPVNHEIDQQELSDQNNQAGSYFIDLSETFLSSPVGGDGWPLDM